MPSNQELLDAVVESWERQDLEAWLATCQPDAVLHTALLFPDFEPAYRGHDGLREFWRTLQEPWDTLRIRVVRMTELSDDEIVVEYHFVGEGGASGASTDLRLFNAVRLRDGLTSQLFAASRSRTPKRPCAPARDMFPGDGGAGGGTGD